MNKMDYIRNVKLNYVSLREGEEDSYGKYGLQIEFSKDRTEELKCFGKLKPLDNGNMAININTVATYGKSTKRAGQRKVIPIINTSKDLITERVGNGSIGDVKVFTYAAQAAHNGMKSAPMALLVRKLEVYVPDELDDFDLGTPTTIVSETTNDNF